MACFMIEEATLKKKEEEIITNMTARAQIG